MKKYKLILVTLGIISSIFLATPEVQAIAKGAQHVPTFRKIDNEGNGEDAGRLIASILEFDFYDKIMSSKINIGYEKGSTASFEYKIDTSVDRFRKFYNTAGYFFTHLGNRYNGAAYYVGGNRSVGHRTDGSRNLGLVSGIGKVGGGKLSSQKEIYLSKDGTIQAIVSVHYPKDRTRNTMNVKIDFQKMKNAPSVDTTFAELLHATIDVSAQAFDSSNTQVRDRGGRTTVRLTGWDEISKTVKVHPAPMIKVNSINTQTFKQNDALPAPNNFVSVTNNMVKGKLAYSWISKPDMSKAGLQDAKIKVIDTLDDYKNTVDVDIKVNVGDNSISQAGPSNLTVITEKHDSIDLEWDAPSSVTDVVKYEIFRNGAMIDSIQSNSTSYIDSEINETESYEYAVRAIYVNGYTSVFSNKVIGTTLQNLPPSNVKVTDVKSKQMTMEWESPPQKDVKQYIIISNGREVGKVNGDVLSFTKKGLTTGVTYRYSVLAVFSNNSRSPISQEVTAYTVRGKIIGLKGLPNDYYVESSYNPETQLIRFRLKNSFITNRPSDTRYQMYKGFSGAGMWPINLILDNQIAMYGAMGRPIDFSEEETILAPALPTNHAYRLRLNYARTSPHAIEFYDYELTPIYENE